MEMKALAEPRGRETRERFLNFLLHIPFVVLWPKYKKSRNGHARHIASCAYSRPLLLPRLQFSQFFSLFLSSLSSHGRIKKVCEKWTLCLVKTNFNHLFCSVLLIFFSSNSFSKVFDHKISGMLDKYFHILVSSWLSITLKLSKPF